ncbi:acyl-CoA carboxylase epsilon subunit [Streptomyces sp. NPDC085524]|uniref:acyl-CoA carboxylase epsilon subunit n=1 Tax=unclassified Streptomyces TaxID=2593676 RepID=UPI0035D85A81
MTAVAPGAGVELALASLRITGGNPSREDVAALAAVLAARFAPGASGTQAGDGRGPEHGRTRWQEPAGAYRAPGAWVS